MVMHVHGKSAPNRRNFNSQGEIAQKTFDDLIAQFPAEFEGVDPPFASVPLANNASSSDSKNVGLRELNADGHLTTKIMAEAGYIVGAKVQRKGGTASWISTRSTRPTAR